MSVTLDDIAQSLGVTKATVSRALNEQPCVAPRTRERILEAARRLGYEPDPALRALSDRRWAKSGRPFRYSAAILHMHRPTDADRQRTGSRALMFPAICEAGQRLGLQISDVFLSDHETPEQLNRVLHACGIEGVLLNIDRPVMPWRFNWQHLSFVSLGLGCNEARYVASDWFGAVRLAVTRARARGYGRVGHVELRHGNPEIEQQIAAGFALSWQELEPKLGLQPAAFSVPGSQGQPPRWHEIERDFLRWVKRERPDVIVDGTLRVRRWLEANGWTPGDRPGLVTLFRRYGSEHAAIAAIEHHFEEQGRLAVEMLASLIQHRIRGLPELPARMVVPCGWHEGDSLPPLTSVF